MCKLKGEDWDWKKLVLVANSKLSSHVLKCCLRSKSAAMLENNKTIFSVESLVVVSARTKMPSLRLAEASRWSLSCPRCKTQGELIKADLAQEVAGSRFFDPETTTWLYSLKNVRKNIRNDSFLWERYWWALAPPLCLHGFPKDWRWIRGGHPWWSSD